MRLTNLNRPHQISLFVFFIFVNSAFSSGFLSELKTTAALDSVLPLYSTDPDSRNTFNPQVRSAEIMFYSPVDHLFEGAIGFAGHTEDGEFFFELHEGYLSTSKLIPYSRIRAGKFFLGVGRLNQKHQHDWSFTSAPTSHETFFASEGAADTGIEYTLLLPSEHFFELTFGASRNYCYGHCHGGGTKPPRPLLYFRPLTFFETSTNSGIQFGLTYLNRVDSSMVTTHLAGIDLTYKMREGRRVVWLSQTEFYFEYEDSRATNIQKNIGGYQFLEYGLNESWYTGLRFDAFSDLSRQFISNNARRGNLEYSLVPQITWRPSEFSMLRLSYEVNIETLQGIKDRVEQLALFQWTFILGAHPAHDF